MDKAPVPGTVQAIWQQTLTTLRTNGQGQAAALWAQTYPTARTLDSFTVAAPTPFVASALAKARLAPLITAALAHAAGCPLRLCCTVYDGPPDEEQDPVIREMLRRIAAKHQGRLPQQHSPLDASSPAS